MSKLHDNPFRPDYDNGAPDTPNAGTPRTDLAWSVQVWKEPNSRIDDRRYHVSADLEHDLATANAKLATLRELAKAHLYRDTDITAEALQTELGEE